MSEQEEDAVIPPGSEANQGEHGGEETQGEPGGEENQGKERDDEHKDEALSASEVRGEAGNEEEILPGVSASEEQGQPVNEDETLPAVSNPEDQGKPRNEEGRADDTLPENGNSSSPGNENETVPGASASEDQEGPGNTDDTSMISTSEDQREPGNTDDTILASTSEDQGTPVTTDNTAVASTSEDQGEGHTDDSAVESTSEDQGEAGKEEEQGNRTLSEVKTSEDREKAGNDTSLANSSEDLGDVSEGAQEEDTLAEVKTSDGGPGGEEEEQASSPGPDAHPGKTFLGGYRNKLTGVEYHNASAQTPRRARPYRVEVVCRDAQTAEQVPQAQQCASSVTTQMNTVGCYISNQEDKLISPGHYITAEQYHDTRLKAVIRLQAHTRRWLSCRKVDRLRWERDRRLAWLDLQERRRREERAEQLQDCHNRWMQPRKKEDLNLLYNALEKWRSEKERQINAALRGSERKAALCSLLEQETQYIATIGRHGIAIKSNNYSKAVRKFLDKAHPCQLTREILELIGREEDLMKRQVKAANLEGLRKRLSTYFLQFIRTPGFNPEVAKHLKVPRSTSQPRNDVFLCHGCQRYLGAAHFRSCARAHLSRRCLDCARLKNIGGVRDDFSCYKHMLKKLRDGELVLNKDNVVPFILQVEDIQYLVEVIWGSRSALSGNSDLLSLVLVRWERHQDWSPWNCVLLCKDETDAHFLVEDVRKVYDVPVIRGIEHKHLLARRHYNQIPAMVAHSAKAATKRSMRRL